MLVKQSGDHIRIKSRLGEDTSITLYFARHLGTDARGTMNAPEAEVPDGGTETILVVEDDDDVRAYTVSVLRELGSRVIEAHDGVTASKLIDRAELPIALLLNDVVMPVMSGRKLAQAAQAIQPVLRVLYLSGYTRDAITRDGRLEPGVDLLSSHLPLQRWRKRCAICLIGRRKRDHLRVRVCRGLSRAIRLHSIGRSGSTGSRSMALPSATPPTRQCDQRRGNAAMVSCGKHHQTHDNTGNRQRAMFLGFF